MQCHKGTVYLGSYYRPPDSKNIALDHLQDSFNKIFSKRKNLPNIVLAGDCNFPDINWENTSTTKTSTQACHNLFLNLLNENGLTQMTRDTSKIKHHTWLSHDNQLRLGQQCASQTRSKLSDHEVVLFDINMALKKQRKPSHIPYTSMIKLTK